ncbi:MAG TPA: PIN domain-containing protein, partial [Planctomycetaceae bacterium]
MRVLLDTSVLVAAMVTGHPEHLRALPWLQRIKAGTDEGVVSAHSLAETYAILTTLPLRPPIRPAVARQLIERNILADFEVVALSEADYRSLLGHLETVGIAGGATYDAVVLHAAAIGKVDRVVTLNTR